MTRSRCAATSSFDALSPDGRWLYLIEYVAPKELNQYAVRLYDLTAGRLLPEPIVDYEEAAEPMRGYPHYAARPAPTGASPTRSIDGAGEHPFIHALDTVGRATAVCIDLHGLMGRGDLYDLRLAVSEDGSTLEVRGGSDAASPSSTRGLRGRRARGASGAPAACVGVTAGDAAAPAPVAPRPQPGRTRGDRVPWALVGCGERRVACSRRDRRGDAPPPRVRCDGRDGRRAARLDEPQRPLRLRANPPHPRPPPPPLTRLSPHHHPSHHPPLPSPQHPPNRRGTGTADYPQEIHPNTLSPKSIPSPRAGDRPDGRQ